jgi:hypothetical protein
MNRTSIILSSTVAAVALLAAVGLSASGDDSPSNATSATTTPPVSASSEPATQSIPPTSSTLVTTADFVIPDEVALVSASWPTEWAIRTIDLAELKVGIRAPDSRDRIRPLDQPTYESIDSADEWLVDREIGVSLELGETARFYPLRILTSHEIVNDELDGIPFAVTYCPLCNTAVAFDRRVDGEVLRFGVSGLLRNSDLVMWDDKTVSLWQQITGEGIVGTLAGTRLEVLPTATVRWADFKENHPDGQALSENTGFGFNYGSNAYAGYSSRPAPFAPFFDGPLDDRFPALDRVVGVRVDDSAKAYPFAVIEDDRAVNDELAGVPIAVWWAPTDAADNFDGEFVGQGESIGTGIAFLRTIDGQVLTFEASGDSAFIDNETGSRWTLFGEAVQGPLAGTQLELAPHQNEFWFAWIAFNSDSPVHGG